MSSYLVELLASDTDAWARLRDRSPTVELVASTVAERRTVTELEVTLDATDGRWSLPVAVVSDISADDAGAVRAYFSTWPLTGRHEVWPLPICRE